MNDIGRAMLHAFHRLSAVQVRSHLETIAIDNQAVHVRVYVVTSPRGKVITRTVSWAWAITQADREAARLKADRAARREEAQAAELETWTGGDLDLPRGNGGGDRDRVA